MNRNTAKPVVILNGRKARNADIRAMIRGINDPAVRMEKGGYLFRCTAVGSSFHLGIVPVLHEGRRNHHYDIEMPRDAAYVLVGTIPPEGTMSLLFIPPKRTLDADMRNAYAEQYRVFASTLLSWGYRRPGTLDQITRDLLSRSGVLDPPPRNLVEIGQRES